MALVTGVVADFGLANLTADNPSIAFIPSGVAVSTTVHLLTTKPIYAVITPTGSFTVDLTPNIDLRPDTYYSIRIEWLDPAGNYTSIDLPGFKLVVPPEGGALPDLLIGDLSNFYDVWVGEVDNPVYPFWYQPSTGLLRK